MEDSIRRVAGLILQAPLTRRNRHELLYCGFGGLAGVAGFWLTLVLLAVGFTVSASIIGTVIGLVLVTVTLRVSRRLGSLHRRLLRRFLGHQVEAPLPFQPLPPAPPLLPLPPCAVFVSMVTASTETVPPAT